MNDKEFINALFKSYLPNSKFPHTATLNNAIINRLNDISDKLEKQEKFIDIVKRKGMYISAKELIRIDTYEDYKDFLNVRKLQQELMMHITPVSINWNNLDNTSFYAEEEFNTVKEILKYE